MQLKLHQNGPVEDLFEKLDDTRFNLIVIGQPDAAVGARALSHLVQTHMIPVDPINEKAVLHARLSGPSFYLVRPDGHGALAGTRFDAAAVTRYLTERHISLDTLRSMESRRANTDIPTAGRSLSSAGDRVFL